MTPEFIESLMALRRRLEAKDAEIAALKAFIRQAFIKSISESSVDFAVWFFENVPEELRGEETTDA